jgi:hypothetical protein
MFDENIEKFNKYILSKNNNETIYLHYKTQDNFSIKLEKCKCKNSHSDIFTESISIYINSNNLESYDEDSDSFDTIGLYFKRIYYHSEKDNIGKILYEKIKSLQFDKYYGSYNNDGRELLDIEIELFPEHFKDKICSVCYDVTSSQTVCGHTLCYLCWENILDKGNSLCPLCRECIRFINHVCFLDECKCRRM